MAATRTCPDVERWARWLDEQPAPGRAHLLVDPALADSGLVRSAHAMLHGRGVAVRCEVVGPGGGLGELHAHVGEVGDGDLVVGIGGGSVMDRAKLLALLASDSSVGRRLAIPQRCGMIVLPSGVLRRVALALVPTTLGTGAEMGRSACLEVDGRKRLVFGEGLRADSVIHAAEATDTLPSALVAEGILEALLRLSMPYIAGSRPLPQQDELVERHVVRLVQLADEVRGARDAGLPVPREVRLATAWISGASHTDDVVGGRDQYRDVSWPLANELSTATGTRKLPALAVVAPAVWRRVSAGDERLGSAPRLARLWDLMRDAARREVGVVPADGLAALVDHWGIERGSGWSRADPDALADAAAHAWGRGLPMLRGLSVAEVASLYTDAITRTADGMSDTRPERRTCDV
jgi:Iron-containing alcohol dehydrogenase